MKAEYITHMGDDLLVVNAARVSMDKASKWLEDTVNDGLAPNDMEHRVLQEMLEPWEKTLQPKDAKLLSYLAKHSHWTPFGHPQVCLRITVPLFVAAQLKRHQTGFVVNEVSRRYVDSEPEFFQPDAWRARPEASIKQGSGGLFQGFVTMKGGMDGAFIPEDLHAMVCRNCLKVYLAMIEAGVAPEMARMVLPQSMYTSWYWTGSLAAWARAAVLRLDPHAQKESRDVFLQIASIIRPLFPVSWRVLVDERVAAVPPVQGGVQAGSTGGEGNATLPV